MHKMSYLKIFYFNIDVKGDEWWPMSILKHTTNEVLIIYKKKIGIYQPLNKSIINI